MKKARKFNDKIFGTLLFLGLSIFYYWFHRRVAISSDTVTLLPMAMDFLRGNVLLKGWVLGSNNFYFTDMIFMALGFAIGLSKEVILNLIPACTNALLIVLILFFFFDIKSIKNLKNDWPKVAVIFMFFCFFGINSWSAAYTLLNVNSHNIIYLLFVLALMFIWAYHKSGKKRYIALYIVMCTLSAFSDTVTLMVIFAPICAYSIWCMIKKDRIKSHAVIIGSSAVSYIFARIGRMILESCGGMKTLGTPIALISIRAYFARFVAFVKEFYAFFDFHGLHLCSLTSAEGIYHTINAIYMFFIVAAIIYNTIFFYKIPSKRLILLLCSLINGISCIITTVDVYHRYIAPLYVFGTCLMIMTLEQWIRTFKRIVEKPLREKIKFVPELTACVLVLFSVINGTWRFRNFLMQDPVYGNSQKAVAQIVSDQNWGNGYADFWSGPLISYYTNGDMNLYPIRVLKYSKKILPHPNLIYKDWYDQKDIHYILTEKSTILVNQNRLIKILGEPDEVIDLGGYFLRYWKKDISEDVYTYSEAYE